MKRDKDKRETKRGTDREEEREADSLINRRTDRRYGIGGLWTLERWKSNITIKPTSNILNDSFKSIKNRRRRKRRRTRMNSGKESITHTPSSRQVVSVSGHRRTIVFSFLHFYCIPFYCRSHFWPGVLWSPLWAICLLLFNLPGSHRLLAFYCAPPKSRTLLR